MCLTSPEVIGNINPIHQLNKLLYISYIVCTYQGTIIELHLAINWLPLHSISHWIYWVNVHIPNHSWLHHITLDSPKARGEPSKKSPDVFSQADRQTKISHSSCKPSLYTCTDNYRLWVFISIKFWFHFSRIGNWIDN